MARKDFWEILAAAVQRRFAVTIFSNGTLIDEARAEQLATFPLAGVEVSLHGADAAVHDRIVGKPGAYVRTLRAIEALDARGLHVTVKMSLMKQNVDDARILERRFENAKNITLKVSPRLFPRDDGDSEPCDMHLDEDQELAYHRRRLAEAPQGLPSDKIKLKVLSFDPATAEPCGAGRTLAVILPNGDVLPCPMLHHVKMGNVREKPFSSIWLDSDEVRELRALTLSKWEECRGCPFISVCNHCPAISMAETGKMHGWSSQVCQSTKTFWTAVREKYRAEGREPPI
jgi:radical SAM protein with 4Fe4S-binding SPASM domain